MSDIESELSRPRFRDLVIYEGAFDREAVARRLFEWLVEIDPPGAAAHAEFLRSLQARGLDRNAIVAQSYDRLYQDLFNYCELSATWGWEAVDPTTATPAARLGFWPHGHTYEPGGDESGGPETPIEPPSDDEPTQEPNPIWPLGGRLESSRLHDVLVQDAQRLAEHLGKVAEDAEDPDFRLGPPNQG